MDEFAEVFVGDQVLTVMDHEYHKVDGDSDVRNKYDEI